MTEEIDNILNYLKKTGLSSIDTNSPVWKILHSNKVDIPMGSKSNKIIDITMKEENGQKMTVGKLVTHRTVPQLGLGLVVAESKVHKNYWIVQWCDRRYGDVGQLGIGSDYLEIV